MKKNLLLCAFILLGANMMKAQTVLESKLTDNWFVGADGGVYVKASHSSLFKDMRPMFGVKLGRYLTPVFGVRGDVQLYINDPKIFASKTAISTSDFSLDGLFNFNNLFSGYLGQPRKYEFVGVLGIGWSHGYGLPKNLNFIATKFGMQMNYNFGDKKQWQINLEPDLVYLTRSGNGHSAFNINRSAFQLTAGVTYKFKCSNKTHNFVIAKVCDESQIENLNALINSQKDALSAKDAIIESNQDSIASLNSRISKLENSEQPVPAISNNTYPTSNKKFISMVIFDQGKTYISSKQAANIDVIATYMKDNPKAVLVIKGYASSEGNKAYNQTLSEKRAYAVKDVLVNNYDVDPNRLITKGYGCSEKVFENNPWNRVCVFVEK